jgi:hypothetical protein
VYGSFHGCVDFLLVARVIMVSFFELFLLDFRARLVPWVRICWWGSWIDVLYILVLDDDPSISGFGLRLKDFGWNPSFLVELGSRSILGDLVGLRQQVLGHSIF